MVAGVLSFCVCIWWTSMLGQVTIILEDTRVKISCPEFKSHSQIMSIITSRPTIFRSNVKHSTAKMDFLKESNLRYRGWTTNHNWYESFGRKYDYLLTRASSTVWMCSLSQLQGCGLSRATIRKGGNMTFYSICVFAGQKTLDVVWIFI